MNLVEGLFLVHGIFPEQEMMLTVESHEGLVGCEMLCTRLTPGLRQHGSCPSSCACRRLGGLPTTSADHTLTKSHLLENLGG